MTVNSRQPLTGYHQAGHAVAAAMCGDLRLAATFLTEGTRLDTAHETAPSGPSSGLADLPFIGYAGPWAEARSVWPAGPLLDGLRTLDSADIEFDDYVTSALLSQPGDLAATLSIPPPQSALRAGAPTGDVLAPERSWHLQMERCWWIVEEVATRLIGGHHVTADDIADSLPVPANGPKLSVVAPTVSNIADPEGARP